MEKRIAIDLLGGTVCLAAEACGISPSAVSQWPPNLTKDQIDRVQAALWRAQQLKRKRRKPQPSTSEA